MNIMRRYTLWFTVVLLAAVGQSPWVAASDPGTGDWPMWGGKPDRNMVSNMKGLPTEWDVKTKKNVKWVAQLGSQSYGNPVVADGMVFVGTNNEALRDPKQPGDRGVLMAFREGTGEFLWQQTHEKLESGRANDWPFRGVRARPLVEGSTSTTSATVEWSGASTRRAFATAKTTAVQGREAHGARPIPMSSGRSICDRGWAATRTHVEPSLDLRV
jgi:outer membrane protein assembly factor BamB